MILLAWDNLSDSASLTAGSEYVDLGVGNLQTDHLSQRWHTANGIVSSWVTADLKSVKSCAVAAFVGTNLTAATSLRLRASNSDSTAQTNTVIDTSVWSPVRTGIGFSYVAFGATAARYWRIDVEDLTIGDRLKIGRLFLGPAWRVRALQYGWSLRIEDLSRRTRSEGGQIWVDVGPRVRVLEVELAYQSEEEMYGNAFAMARAIGQARDALCIPIEGGQYVSEQSVWGLVREPQPLIHEAKGLFRQRFIFEERL